MILNIEADLDYAIEGPAHVLLQLGVADLPDQRVTESTLEMIDAPEPIWQPAEDGIGQRGWVAVSEQLRCRYRARVQIDRRVSDICEARQVPLAELPAEAVKYLLPSRYCQSDLFEPFVASEFAGLDGGMLIAAMRDWIEMNFAYVRGSSDETTTVVETFLMRRGVCRDYAHVMITLARAARIPARAVSVYAPDVTPPDFHMIAEIYVGDEWRLIDATGMAQPDSVARMVVGHDAAGVDFMTTFGATQSSPELRAQAVKVTRDGRCDPGSKPEGGLVH